MAPSEAAAADDGPFGGPSGVSDDEWLADASPGPGVGSMPLGPPDAAGTESMMHGAHASVDGEGFTHGIADPISAVGSTNGEADRPSTPPPGTDGQDNDWLGGAPTPSDFAPENPDGWSSLDNSFASKPPPSPLGPKLAAVGADADTSWTEHRASPFGGTDSPQKAPAEVAAHRPAEMMGMMPPVNVTSQPQQTFVVKKASSLGDLFGGGGTDLDDGAYVSPVAASTNPFGEMVDDDDAFFDQLAGAPRQQTQPPPFGAPPPPNMSTVDPTPTEIAGGGGGDGVDAPAYGMDVPAEGVGGVAEGVDALAMGVGGLAMGDGGAAGETPVGARAEEPAPAAPAVEEPAPAVPFAGEAGEHDAMFAQIGTSAAQQEGVQQQQQAAYPGGDYGGEQYAAQPGAYGGYGYEQQIHAQPQVHAQSHAQGGGDYAHDAAAWRAQPPQPPPSLLPHAPTQGAPMQFMIPGQVPAAAPAAEPDPPPPQAAYQDAAPRYSAYGAQEPAYAAPPETAAYAPAPETAAYAPAPETAAYAPAPETAAYAPAPETAAYAPAPETAAYGSQPEVSAYGAPPPAAYAPQFMIPAASARDTPPPEYAPPAPAYQETAPAQYTAYGAQDAAYSAYGEQSAPEPAYAAYGAPPPAAQPAQFMIPSAPAPFQDGPASTTQPAYDTFGGDGGAYGGDGGAYGGDGWAGASPQRAPMTSQGDAQQSQHQQQSQYAPSFEGGYSAYGAAGSSHATGDAGTLRSPHGRPPCPSIGFGVGGNLVVAAPGYPTPGAPPAGGGSPPGFVKIHRLADLVAGFDPQGIGVGGAYLRSLGAVCGPFTRSHSSQHLQKMVDDRVAEARTRGGDEPVEASTAGSGVDESAESNAMLWGLLHAMVKHRGKMTQNVTGADPSGTDPKGPGHDLHALLLGGGVDASSSPSPASAATTGFSEDPIANSQALAEYERLLLAGKRGDALTLATSRGLWSHAMLLARHMGERHFAATAAAMARAACTPGSPLHTLEVMFAGVPQDLVGGQGGGHPSGHPGGHSRTGSIGNAVAGLVGSNDASGSGDVATPGGDVRTLLPRWRENLVILAANRAPGDARVMAALGDALWSEIGDVAASHAAYALAGAAPQPFHPTSRLCLMGGDHRRRPRTYATPAAIQRTELLEHSMVLANAQYVLAPFQAYKLHYAGQLAEFGRVKEALGYAEAVGKAVKHLDRSSPECNVPALGALAAELEHRLKGHSGGKNQFLQKAASSIFGGFSKILDKGVHSLFGDENGPGTGRTPGHSRQSSQSSSNAPPPPQMQAQPAYQQMQGTQGAPTHGLQPTHGSQPMQPANQQSQFGQPQTNTTPGQPPGAEPTPASSGDEGSDFGGKSNPGKSNSTRSNSLWRSVSGVMGAVASAVPLPKPKNQAKLGEEMSMYYSEKLGRWVEPGKEDEVDSTPPPPPPKSFGAAAASPAAGDQTTNQAPTAPTAPGAAPPNNFSMRAPTSGGVRSRYVDTFSLAGPAAAQQQQQAASPVLAGAAGLLPPGLMPPGSPLMPSPLGAGSPMQPMAPMQPMVPMAPAGGGFMMPDAVKVPETVPEDIAGEQMTTPASREPSREPTPAPLQPAAEPVPVAEPEPEPVPEAVPAPEPEPVPTMSMGQDLDPEGRAFFDRADDGGGGYHAPPSPPPIVAAPIGHAFDSEPASREPTPPPPPPPMDVASLVPPPRATTVASDREPVPLPPPPTSFAAREDDGDEWESVPDDETQPLGELDDHPAPVTEPHSPNAFFVPSPDLNPDPSGESVGVYNAGAATTAEADAAYDYGDVAASVGLNSAVSGANGHDTVANTGMVFDAKLRDHTAEETAVTHTQEGYYDASGTWINGTFPGGFHDANTGEWRRGYHDETGSFHAGYVDAATGAWVSTAPEGYYDASGTWHEGQFPGGFVDSSTGVFRHGYYAEDGKFTEGYFGADGAWVDGPHPGAGASVHGGVDTAGTEERWGDVDEGEMTDIAL